MMHRQASVSGLTAGDGGDDGDESDADRKW